MHGGLETMRVWVTGFGGFMGTHLVGTLQNKGEEVLATYFKPIHDVRQAALGTRVIECDLRDRNKVNSLLCEFRPSKIYHLAAQSYPTISWDDPWYTIETNIIGTINLFEGLKKLGWDCKILNACSSAQYGFVTEDEVPIVESHSLKPLHPYGVSKVAQELLAYQYYENFGIKSVSLRIFNTTGPGKVNDVCADFTQRLAELERHANLHKKLRVGNLKAKRALMDVRDAVRAFDLILDKAAVGEAYNLSGETVYEMGEVVDILRGLVDFDFEVWQDPALMRTTDEPIIYGSSEKLKRETGWKQEIPLQDTLKDMLAYWRRRP